jgi:hypothetical protein
VLVPEKWCRVDCVHRCREVVGPYGPSDSSLAVYCQGYRTKKIRSVGNGMNGYLVAISDKITSLDHPSSSHHTVPSGTGLRGASLLAVNCQATIIPSLWDQNSQTFVHILESTAGWQFEHERDLAARSARHPNDHAKSFKDQSVLDPYFGPIDPPTLSGNASLVSLTAETANA